MLSIDIEKVNSVVALSRSDPAWEAWQRIKTALEELGTTPNRQCDAIALAREFKRNHNTGLHHGHVMSEFIAWLQEQQRT